MRYIKTELINLKEALYKDKTTSLRTLVGPPLTMLLIHDGFLTVEQELEAGVLNPSGLIEKPCEKKRKYESQPTPVKGETSKITKEPQIMTAMAAPIQLHANGNYDSHPDTTMLTQILASYNQTTQQLEAWIRRPSGVLANHTVPNKTATPASSGISGLTAAALRDDQQKLRDQLQELQQQLQTTTEKMSN